jgi:hypothetical protein
MRVAWMQSVEEREGIFSFQGLKNYPHLIAPTPRVRNGISIFAIWFSAVWLLCQYLFRSQ